MITAIAAMTAAVADADAVICTDAPAANVYKYRKQY